MPKDKCDHKLDNTDVGCLFYYVGICNNICICNDTQCKFYDNDVCKNKSVCDIRRCK